MAHSATKSYENWSISLTWPINISFSSIWPLDILMLVVKKESNLKLFQFRIFFKARYKCGWLIDWLSYPYIVDKMGIESGAPYVLHRVKFTPVVSQIFFNFLLFYNIYFLLIIKFFLFFYFFYWWLRFKVDWLIVAKSNFKSQALKVIVSGAIL